MHQNYVAPEGASARLLSATIAPTLSAPSGNQAALVACFHSDSYK